MENIHPNRDISDYKTFFICIPDEKMDNYTREHRHIIIRPCKSSYEEVVHGNEITLEGCIMDFDNKESESKIMLTCSLNGITPEFKIIEDSEYRISKLIDLRTNKTIIENTDRN